MLINCIGLLLLKEVCEIIWYGLRLTSNRFRCEVSKNNEKNSLMETQRSLSCPTFRFMACWIQCTLSRSISRYVHVWLLTILQDLVLYHQEQESTLNFVLSPQQFKVNGIRNIPLFSSSDPPVQASHWKRHFQWNTCEAPCTASRLCSIEREGILSSVVTRNSPWPGDLAAEDTRRNHQLVVVSTRTPYQWKHIMKPLWFDRKLHYAVRSRNHLWWRFR